MSIITDALKKAEREREFKVKRASEEEKPVELLAAQAGLVEAALEKEKRAPEEIEENPVREENWSLELGVREVLILGVAIFSCILLLFSLPSWPLLGRDLSLAWHPFRSAPRIFQLGALGSMYQQGVLKTGTVPFADQSVKLPFVLSGISLQEDARYAIVNGVVVQEGDSVDGAHVKQISDREVVLDTRAGEIRLKIQS